MTIWAPPDIWANDTALIHYYTEHPLPIRLQTGVLIASILVSILGSYATLLVLGRRTSPRGFRNLTLLLLAAVCFASVAVWGMHFVSMISIRLRPTSDGRESWYMTFSPGMTVLSLFVPLIATSFAFWFLASEAEFIWWRGIISGVTVGLTIGLMHYSAAFKLPLLRPAYSVVTVVFALVLACVAATIALGLFFRLREQWQDSFWKRCVCALVLAAAVCGMHYLGLGGASYMIRSDVPVTREALKEGRHQANRLTIAISVMCGCIILLSIVIAVIDYLIRRDIRKKARHIVVASAAFDPTGKLLVRHDGTIPMQIIQTDADLVRVLGELDPRRPTFQWLYQLSFNWSVITPFVPRILRDIASRAKKNEQQPAPTSDRSMNRTAWEQLLFRSRFVEACVLLAHQLDLSIESLGVMFDRVLTTGVRQQPKGEKQEDEKHPKSDDESSIHGITLHLNSSEGVMLFIVRTIGNGAPAAHDLPGADKHNNSGSDSIDSYLSRGYRLTETRFFSKTLADNMGVSKQEMDVFLSACKTYAKRGTRPVVQAGGAYLGLFGVRPASDGGLDVLVYNFARHQIPAYRLPDVGYPLTPAMRAFVRECANLPMGEVLAKCNEAVQEAEASDTESQLSIDETLYEFQAAIAVAIEALTTALRCWPDLQQTARLSPEILDLPTSETDDKVPAQMIMLEVVLGAPEARITPVQSRASGVQAPGVRSGRTESDKPPPPFVYTPYILFTKSQAMLMRSRTCAEYCRNTQADLARLYPFVANDVAAEIEEADDKGGSSGGSNLPTLFENASAPGSKWNSRMSKITKGLSVDTRGVATPSIHSPNEMPISSSSEFDGESIRGVASSITGLMGSAQSPPGRSSRPPKASSFRGMRDATSPSDDEESQSPNDPGPPVYANVRAKTDGWFNRNLRVLLQNDRGGLLADVNLAE